METKDIYGKVDFGIITIREDEFTTVLKRFPKQDEAIGQRYYNLSRIKSNVNTEYLVAVVRCVEQGGKESLNVARDLIEDLAPKCLILVGIAGGVPDYEFTLGDVVIATRLHDFSVEAALEGRPPEYASAGGPMLKRVRTLAVNLSAMTDVLGEWNNSSSIGMEQPPVIIAPENLYGDLEWQNRVRETLESRFAGAAPQRAPKVYAGAIASSDRLVKDSDLIKTWKETARQVIAVEMELHGVYGAADRVEGEYPVIAIRGISDIVGFKRDPKWTQYACEAAASFTSALIKSGSLKPLLHVRNIGTAVEDHPRSLFKEVNEKACVIYDHKRNEHVIPLELPGLSRRTGSKAWEHAGYWKRVHTLTGSLYERYLDFHLCVVRYKQSSTPEADTHRKYAQDHLRRLRNDFADFKDSLARLPPSVSKTETIKALQKIHLCSDPIMHSLVSPVDSSEFQHGVLLVEAVGGWLLRALRIADSIIEVHFSKLGETA